jgi:hypothetical protein
MFPSLYIQGALTLSRSHGCRSEVLQQTGMYLLEVLLQVHKALRHVVRRVSNRD